MENAVSKLVKNEKINTQEEAVEIANEIKRLEAVVSTMKKHLRTYVEANGKVETADTVWYMNTSVSWKFNPEQLRNVASVMALEGIKPWDYLNITPANLKKLDWDEKTLNKMGTRKESTGLKSKKR